MVMIGKNFWVVHLPHNAHLTYLTTKSKTDYKVLMP